MKKVLFSALFALFALVSAASFATTQEKKAEGQTEEQLPVVEGAEEEGKEKK
ncbi:MAG: hypothetical protein ACRCYZ_04365 [Alphaproteobacteria bacterium]